MPIQANCMLEWGTRPKLLILKRLKTANSITSSSGLSITFDNSIEDLILRISALLTLIYMMTGRFGVIRWDNTTVREFAEEILKYFSYLSP